MKRIDQLYNVELQEKEDGIWLVYHTSKGEHGMWCLTADPMRLPLNLLAWAKEQLDEDRLVALRPTSSSLNKTTALATIREYIQGLPGGDWLKFRIACLIETVLLETDEQVYYDAAHLLVLKDLAECNADVPDEDLFRAAEFALRKIRKLQSFNWECAPDAKDEA